MPTVAGFLQFIRGVVGIPANYLPDTAPVITMAFDVAVAITNEFLCQIDPLIYDLAVYNLAADNLINFAPDQSVAISGIAWASGTATATTAAPGGFLTGDSILIAGNAPLAYNSQPGPANTVLATGIVVTSASTFQYEIPVNPGVFTQGGTASQTYFASLRRAWNINGFVGGIVSASSDVSTSQTLVTPEFMKDLTLSDLQNLKTPYGRRYLAYAQMYGSLWGLS